jgi:hypothetical protein
MKSLPTLLAEHEDKSYAKFKNKFPKSVQTQSDYSNDRTIMFLLLLPALTLVLGFLLGKLC